MKLITKNIAVNAIPPGIIETDIVTMF